MLNPYELLYMNRSGDEYSTKVLFLQCRPLLYREVSALLAVNPDMETYKPDLVMEGEIAIYQAMDAYREDMDTSFVTFAMTVARNKVRTEIRHYRSKKYIPGKDIQSLDEMYGEKGPMINEMEQQDRLAEPEYVLNLHMAHERMLEKIQALTPKEQKVLLTWAQNMSYERSAEVIGVSEKQYDSIKQRVRKKIKNSILCV